MTTTSSPHPFEFQQQQQPSPTAEELQELVRDISKTCSLLEVQPDVRVVQALVEKANVVLPAEQRNNWHVMCHALATKYHLDKLNIGGVTAEDMRAFRQKVADESIFSEERVAIDHEKSVAEVEQSLQRLNFRPTVVIPAGTVLFHGSSVPWDRVTKQTFFTPWPALASLFAKPFLGVFYVKRAIRLLDLRQADVDSTIGKRIFSDLFPRHGLGETDLEQCIQSTSSQRQCKAPGASLSSVARRMGFDGWAAYDMADSKLIETDVQSHSTELIEAELLQARGFGKFDPASAYSVMFRALEVVIDDPSQFVELALWRQVPQPRGFVPFCGYLTAVRMAQHGVYIYESWDRQYEPPHRQKRTLTDVGFARRFNVLQSVEASLLQQEYCTADMSAILRGSAIMVVHPSLEGNVEQIDNYLVRAGVSVSALARRTMYMLLANYKVRRSSHLDPGEALFRQVWMRIFEFGRTLFYNLPKHGDQVEMTVAILDFAIQKGWVDSKTVLDSAQMFNIFDAVLLLHERGYIQTTKQELDRLLIETVQTRRSTKYVTRLLKLGADPNARTTADSGETPLQIIEHKYPGGGSLYAERVKKLLQKAGGARAI